MSGSANLCTESLLVPGAPCIIEVDPANNPTGYWWGTVKTVERRDYGLVVVAEISGGPFCLDSNWNKVLTNDKKGSVPCVNYHVYPDTETYIRLVQKLLAMEEKVQRERNNALRWKQTHLDTMAHLVGLKLVK